MALLSDRSRKLALKLLVPAFLCLAGLELMRLMFSPWGYAESGIRPRDFESIKVYNTSGVGFLEMDKAGLAQDPFVLIEKKEYLDLFRNAYYRAGPTRWKWKAPLGCTVELKDGSNCRLCLSYGMGFFQILGQDGYYSIAEEDWEEFRNMVKWMINTLNGQSLDLVPPENSIADPG